MFIDTLPADVFYLLAAMLLPVDLARLLRTCRACAAHGRSWQLWSVRADLRLRGKSQQFNALRRRNKTDLSNVYRMFCQWPTKTVYLRIRMPSTSVVVKTYTYTPATSTRTIETTLYTPDTICSGAADKLIFWFDYPRCLSGRLMCSRILDGGEWIIEMECSNPNPDAIEYVKGRGIYMMTIERPRLLGPPEKSILEFMNQPYEGPDRYTVTVTSVWRSQDDSLCVESL